MSKGNKNKKLLIGCFNNSVILTYVGLASSVCGMISIINGNSKYAMILMIVSGLCDLFDGTVARKCKRNNIQKEFGIQIDSLIDVVSFLIFPIILCLHHSYFTPIAIAVSVVYTVCGVTRLAWFNMYTEVDKNTVYYTGLPVTFISIIIPIWYTICTLIEQSIFYLHNQIILWAILIVMAALFVLDIPIKKPKGLSLVVILLITLITLLTIIFIPDISHLAY